MRLVFISNDSWAMLAGAACTINIVSGDQPVVLDVYGMTIVEQAVYRQVHI